MSLDELISKEELLAGMPAKRAKTLLFLIEKQTALLTKRSRVAFSLTDSDREDGELAFLQAFTINNSQIPRPTIQQLERFAPEWSVLVPKNPQIKAALIRALTEKYRFTPSLIPNICQALGHERRQVQQAYHRLYHKPLVTAFLPKISALDRYGWGMFAIAQKLESLPPFWLATLVTVALGLPQAFLALPIAVAQLGSIGAVILLISLGIINILTMTCMAEAISRSQDFRSGETFIKQLAANYLGKAGSVVLSVAVSIRVFLIALACYLGLSATMANFTNLPATLWAGLLFFLGLYILSRQSINLTVGFTVCLAVINVSVLLIISFLCFNHWQLDNLLYVNWNLLRDNSGQSEILHQVLGVTLMLYFGHVYVGECAKIVLPKDKSANSLIQGSIAGTACLTFLFCFWVVAVNGAIAPDILASQTGTVLEPLIGEIGWMGKILGAILVTLLLGMAWLRSSSLLVNLSREWIPSQKQSTLTLPRQQGRLILQTRDRYNSSSIALTYVEYIPQKLVLHLDLQLQGHIYQQDIEIDKYWSIQELSAQYPEIKGIDLSLKVRSANRDRITLQIISPLGISYQGTWQTEIEDKISGKNRDNKSKLAQISTYLREQRHLLLSFTPLFLVFLLTEALFFAGKQSFTGVLGFAGVLGNSLVGGIFPILLLISSRRKGELLPGKIIKLLDYPWLLGSIYSFFLLILLSHGLFIWSNPLARMSALGVTFLSLAATLVMLLTGAFIPRTVIEFQENQEEAGQGLLTITTGGKPKTSQVRLEYTEGESNYQAASVTIPTPNSLRYVSFQLPTKQLEELRVWAHHKNLTEDSFNLPSLLEIYQDNKKMQFDLKLFGGRVLLPIMTRKCWCKLEFSAARDTG